MAERWESEARTTGFGNRRAEQQGMLARRLTYFVVGTVAYQDVCTLDQALDKARTQRPVGYTPEQAYFEALVGYVRHE